MIDMYKEKFGKHLARERDNIRVCPSFDNML